MTLSDSLNIMNISSCDFKKMNIFDLKKKYHSLAKKLHPDKGGSNDKFQQLGEAYNTLNAEILSTLKTESINTSNANEYFEILRFLSQHKNINDLVYQKCRNLISHIITGFQQYVHQFNKKNKKAIELHPSMDDLYSNNLCKYVYDGRYFLVPLWHSEVHFEYDDKSLVFYCDAIVPENVHVDKYNNVHIQKYYNIIDVIKQNELTVEWYQSIFKIPVHELYIKTYQTYTFSKAGLSEINVHDMYDISNKMDVIIHLHFRI